MEGSVKSLIRDIENESIDKTHWVPRKEDVIPVIRFANGDLERNNGSYTTLRKLPIDSIFEMDVITRDHHISGLDIISLREVSLSANGYSRPRFMADWLGRQGESLECPFTTYTRVMRHLAVWQIQTIERICFNPVTDLAWVNPSRGSIYQSFEQLTKAIDKVREIKVQYETEEGIPTPRI